MTRIGMKNMAYFRVLQKNDPNVFHEFLVINSGEFIHHVRREDTNNFNTEQIHSMKHTLKEWLLNSKSPSYYYVIRPVACYIS